MTFFYLACAGFIVVSALFLLLPRSPSQSSAADQAEENLAWYRLRERELADEDAALTEDARLRLLEDSPKDVRAHGEPAGAFAGWVLIPVVALVAVCLYYYLGGVADVRLTERLAKVGSTSAEGGVDQAEMAQLIADIEQRAQRRPENLHYLALLARYHMGREDYQQALVKYEQILAIAPNDPQALAFAAQAQYLAEGRQLQDETRLRAEQSLAADPSQRTALGLLGMASYEQGQYRAAIEYWSRLQAMEPPGSEGGQVIADVIARAQQALAAEGSAPGSPTVKPGAPTAPLAAAPDEQAAGVTVQVKVPDGASIGSADAVFVLARNAASDSRMPLAVVRLNGAQLPATVRLDDNNSMAGQKISQVESVMVSVQVSPDGRPGEANATWLASAGPLAPNEDGAILELVLAPR